MLPAGPTAYFKLTSVQLGSQIFVSFPLLQSSLADDSRVMRSLRRILVSHWNSGVRPGADSFAAELILNNFTTILGNSVGRLFGSLFPPQPQFRGRQVVTLHNQRDFLFFRRHRYMFASPTSAKLQEIGPRFTLKLRWLRKGLPSVTAADGSVPRAGGKEEVDEAVIDRSEAREEDEAMEEMNGGSVKVPQMTAEKAEAVHIPPLDEEQEYEWKWKVSTRSSPPHPSSGSSSRSFLAQDGSVSSYILPVTPQGECTCLLHVTIDHREALVFFSLPTVSPHSSRVSVSD